MIETSTIKLGSLCSDNKAKTSSRITQEFPQTFLQHRPGLNKNQSHNSTEHKQSYKLVL